MRLSIHQTLGQLGIETHWASQTMHSPSGELSIEQPHAEMQIKSFPGRLTIDSSDAWDALGHGNNSEWNSRIYSESKSVLIQAIAKIVADGERMADLLGPNNPIAEIAKESMNQPSGIDYTGTASNLNVKVSYEAQQPEIQVTPRKPVIEFIPQKPQIQYNAGNVDVYIRQKNSIDIQVVNQYDLLG